MAEIDARKILIYLAVKYNGDFSKINHALHLYEGKQASYEEIEEVCNSIKSNAITILDEGYPEDLKRIYHPPLVLFYYGDVTLLNEGKHRYAVLGSRDYSGYGELVTKRLVEEMGPETIVVSGLARGIDTIAHESALENNTKTIAVLGSGIDYCYPMENKDLYEKIKKGGLIISEYPGMSEPTVTQMPLRNRIIVALSEALIVPQINSLTSGTMMAISIAAEVNKSVYIAPHSIFEETANNELILEGAIPILSGQQILKDLHWDKNSDEDKE